MEPKNTVKFLELDLTYLTEVLEIFQEFKRQDFYILITIGYGKVVEIHTGLNFTKETVLSPFSISKLKIDPGIYDHKEFQFVLYTNPNNEYH